MSLFNHPVDQIAFNTWRGVGQEKMFYALAGGGVLILLAGFVLGPLSLNEQARLAVDFSLTACHIACGMTAVYFAGVCLSSESSNLTLFTKPVSKGQIVRGKFLGIALVLSVLLLFFSLAVSAVYGFYGRPITFILWFALWGVWLEALVLAAAALLLSLLFPPFLTFMYVFFVFVIGHSINSVFFFVDKAPYTPIKTMVLMFTRLWPNLEKFNWRSHALYQTPLPPAEILYSTAYAMFWLVFLLWLAGLLLERKDIG